MLQNDVLHGERRNYYSVRLILLCMASAVVAASVVGLLAVVLITSNTRGNIYDNSVRACFRNNQLREESNARIAQHELDARNLGALATRLSGNRKREAGVFAALGGAFDITKQVSPLVRILNRAAEEDQRIADSQESVRFQRLSIIDCRDTDVIPRP